MHTETCPERASGYRAAGKISTFGHARSAIPRCRRRQFPRPRSVGDIHVHRARPPDKLNLDVGPRGMLPDMGERFLGGTVQCQLSVRSQRRRDSPVAVGDMTR